MIILSPLAYSVSRSQRKTNTIYHSYVESKKRHKGTYLQDINRLTDTKNKFVITKGERGKG